MKVSTRGRYGLRAMIDLALNCSGDYVSLAEISQRQDLSYNYLESIFTALKRANLVIGIAGAQGGYMLTCDVQDITVYMILEALEGDISIIGNFDKNATKFSSFLKQNVWDIVDEKILNLLQNTTLQDLAKDFLENRG